MKAFGIGLVELKRVMRDRTNLFFVFLFPLILILLLGLTFGGGFVPKVGVVALDQGALKDELVRALRNERSFEMEAVDQRQSLLDEVERGVFEAGVVVPGGYTAALQGGEPADVVYVSKPGEYSAAIRAAIASAVTEQSARLRAAWLAMEVGDIDFEGAYTAAANVAREMPRTDVRFTSPSDQPPAPAGFEPGASSMLVLFTFVNSLAASVALVQVRQYGVLRRMLVAPLRASTILLGESLGRFLVALLQGVFIVAAAALLFGVDWGDPLGAAAVVALFALVSTGAAMLFGAVLRNEQQAGALVPFGLALAALGGCMVPLEVFPETMRTIAHVTPHAWANEAFQKLIAEGAGVADIVPQLGALTAFAVVLLGAGSVLLRRTLTS